MLSMYNVSVRGIHTPNIVIGMAIFCGGLAQLLAGMWEFPHGNVHGRTTMTTTGGGQRRGRKRGTDEDEWRGQQRGRGRGTDKDEGRATRATRAGRRQ